MGRDHRRVADNDRAPAPGIANQPTDRTECSAAADDVIRAVVREI